MPAAPGDFVIAFDKTNLDAFLRIAPDQVPFAMSFALNKTAQAVKAAEYEGMKAAFDRPTPYVLRSLQFPPWAWATKRKLEATIGFKDGAWQYVKPHVIGGGRSLKRYEHRLFAGRYSSPGRGAKLDKYGNMPGSALTKITSQLGASSDPNQNATNSARSKAKRKASRYFFNADQSVIYERKGKAITPVLVVTRAPTYKPRLDYHGIALTTYQQRLLPNFGIAWQQAMATSGFKGKWT